MCLCERHEAGRIATHQYTECVSIVSTDALDQLGFFTSGADCNGAWVRLWVGAHPRSMRIRSCPAPEGGWRRIVGVTTRSKRAAAELNSRPRARSHFANRRRTTDTVSSESVATPS